MPNSRQQNFQRSLYRKVGDIRKGKMAAKFFEDSKQKSRCFYLMRLFLFFKYKMNEKFLKTFLGIPKEFFTEKADDLTLTMPRMRVTFVSFSSSICIITCWVKQPSTLFSQEFLRQDSEYHLLFSIEFFWELLKNYAIISLIFTKTFLISFNFHYLYNYLRILEEFCHHLIFFHKLTLIMLRICVTFGTKSVSSSSWIW